jgi:hypothetical protein
VFAGTWSSLTKLHIEATSWLDDVAGVPSMASGVSALSLPPESSSRPPNPALVSLTVLLI